MMKTYLQCWTIIWYMMKSYLQCCTQIWNDCFIPFRADIMVYKKGFCGHSAIVIRRSIGADEPNVTYLFIYFTNYLSSSSLSSSSSSSSSPSSSSSSTSSLTSLLLPSNCSVSESSYFSSGFLANWRDLQVTSRSDLLLPLFLAFGGNRRKLLASLPCSCKILGETCEWPQVQICHCPCFLPFGGSGSYLLGSLSHSCGTFELLRLAELFVFGSPLPFSPLPLSLQHAQPIGPLTTPTFPASVCSVDVPTLLTPCPPLWPWCEILSRCTSYWSWCNHCHCLVWNHSNCLHGARSSLRSVVTMGRKYMRQS